MLRNRRKYKKLGNKIKQKKQHIHMTDIYAVMTCIMCIDHSLRQGTVAVVATFDWHQSTKF